tara:strand:- start:3 stop:440 length:438 start_codon:yes stop_codon:yes gene_type:complete
MFLISPLDLDDLKIILEIENKLNPSPWKEETFLSSINVGHRGLICKSQKIICGFIIFSVIKKDAHILNIGVQKKYQRKGAGQLLISSMVKQCKVMGVKDIFLEVRVSNFNAINFYRKLNFNDDAIRAEYYPGNPKEDALLMSRKL